MRYVRLIASSEGASGATGLIVKGTPISEGLLVDHDGTLIAHDLIEHVNGIRKIGGVEDELMACGAIWQVRGRHGDMAMGRPYHPPQVQVASEITDMIYEVTTGEFVPQIGKYRSPAHDYDEDFEDIISIARKGILATMRSEPEDYYDFPIDAYLDNALHLMRMGFRRSARKHGDDGYDTFVAIRDAVRTADDLWEGKQFILGYDSREAIIRECRVGEYA